ncbi:MAG: hypothetical protein Q9160_005091 [Pyrenula sp. 1 TL-2023]
MGDRRRINGPAGGTNPPVFAAPLGSDATVKPRRTRQPNQLRQIYVKIGLVTSASGSAYLELQSHAPAQRSLTPAISSPKFSCTVHGPKPLPRNSSYSANLQLSVNVKFAPFATRNRRGYVRDVSERDIGVHLETALKGIVIADRWPKSAIDVVVTVLEGEEDLWWGKQDTDALLEGCGLMTTLSSCIIVASAALADAGIDCLDLLTAGSAMTSSSGQIYLDPCPSEHDNISACCVVGYLPSRDEVTEIWSKGSLSTGANDPFSAQDLIDKAVTAAIGAHGLLQGAVKESAERQARYLAPVETPSLRKD